MRVGRRILLAVALLATALPASASPDAATPPPTDSLEGGELVDAVVAVVGRRIVTLSQLRTEARLSLAEHGAVEEADGQLGDELLAATLDLVIGEDLVEEEASRLQIFDVPMAETQAALEALSARFPSQAAFQAFLARHGIRAEAARAILRRGLRAQRYIENRLRLELAAQEGPGRLSGASRGGLDAARPAGRLADAALTGPAISPAIHEEKDYFQHRKVEALATGLLNDLRARARVRVLLDLRHAGGPLQGLGAPGSTPSAARWEGAVASPDGAGEP